MLTETEIYDLLKPILHKDLRLQCRARGLNPAGGKETLMERLKDDMFATNNFLLVAEYNGEPCPSVPASATGAPAPAAADANALQNNYSRPEGQNVGNFITDRPTSRVLAPPGGSTNWSLGDGSAVEAGAKATVVVSGAPKVERYGTESTKIGNNYTRPEGQNVGNFLGDRPSSRVLAPPGGGSQITFG